MKVLTAFAVRRSLSLLLAAFALPGCADLQRQQTADVRAKTDDYCRQLYADPRIDPIRNKAPVGMSLSDPIPIQMMSNNDIPTKDEAGAILAWAEQRQNCHQYQTSILGPPPAHMEALRRGNSQLMAELYAGDITYGQFAKQLNQSAAQFMQQDAAIRAQAARDQLQANQALQQGLYQQQQLNLERQRLQTEQLRALQPQQSSPINCTTQYVGNQAYTNCR